MLQGGLAVAAGLLILFSSGLLGIDSPIQTLAPISPELERRLAEAPGESRLPILVQFLGAVTEEDARLLRGLHVSDLVQYEILPVVYGLASKEALERLRESPRVAYIEFDEPLEYFLDTATTTSRAKQLWDATYHTYVDGVHEVHADGVTGAGVSIAIIDTGVDATQRDLLYQPLADAAGLPGKTLKNLKLLGRDSVSGDVFPQGGDLDEAVEGAQGIVKANAMALDVADTDNTGSHGTHVAGIAGGLGVSSNGKYVGAAPGSKIIGLGAGEGLVIHLGLAGFDWVYANGEALNIRIVSNSWGGPGDWNPNSVLTQAIRKLALDKDVIILFAAGNSGGNGSNIQTNVWGNIPEVIMVANYNEGTGFANTGSSRGKTDLERTWPDLMAPGTKIRSVAATWTPLAYVSDEDPPTPILDPYTTFTGTSMATPLVAGVVALLLEVNPTLSFPEVRQILRESAKPVTFVDGNGNTVVTSYETHGYIMGKGLLDAAHAVAAALRMAEGVGVARAFELAAVDDVAAPWILNPPGPVVAITAPEAGGVVDGPKVTVRGTATNFAGDPITLVEVSIDGGPVQAAKGRDDWRFKLSLGGLPDGAHTATAVAFSGTTASVPTTIPFVVNNELGPPSAVILAPTLGDTGTAIAFDASASQADVGHSIVSWDWTLGDGTTATGPTVEHQYAAGGTFTVDLTVTDDVGQTASATHVLKVQRRHDLFLHAGNAMDGTPPPAGDGSADTFTGTSSVTFRTSGSGGQSIERLDGRMFLSTSGELAVIRFTNALFNVSFYEVLPGGATAFIDGRTTEGAFVFPTDPTLRVVTIGLASPYALGPDSELQVTIRGHNLLTGAWRLYYDGSNVPSEAVAYTTT